MIKRNYFLCSAILISLLFLVCPQQAVAWCPDREHHDHHDHQDIDFLLKVVNDSDFDLYITVDGRNTGRVGKHSSEVYKVDRPGSKSVEAECMNCSASESVEFTPFSPKKEVTFKNEHFIDLCKRFHYKY